MGEPRCYMRYGNAGQLYRTCNTNFGSSGPVKPPAVFTPLITQEEFLDKIGKPYSKLSSSQEENYHRLASARSMRKKREEKRKQETMNEEQYKEYLQSKREDTKDSQKNKILYNRKLREEKKLQKQFKADGIKISDKSDIKDFILENVIPNQKEEIESEKYKDNYIQEIIKEGKKEIGDTQGARFEESVISTGNKIANKKDASIKGPTGKTSLGTIIKAFGLEKVAIDLGSGKPLDTAKKNVETLFKALDTVGGLNWSEQSNKFKGSPETLGGYAGLYKNLIAGKVKGPNPNARGLTNDQKAKRKRIQDRIDKIKLQVEKGFKDKEAIKNSFDIARKQREEKIEELNKKAESDFKKHQKSEREEIERKKKYLVDINIRQLEELRNIARKNNFDEKWVKDNIKIAIDKNTGLPTQDAQKLNKDLIKARTIIENIEGIDKKLILSRELKRK